MDKGLLKAMMLCMAVVLLSSCQSEEGKVKRTAQDFLKTLIAGDFEKAREYTTLATQEKWGDFTQFVASQMTTETKEAISKLKIEVTDVEIDGDHAQAICSATVPYLAKEITLLHFVKIDGKWLLDEPDAIVSDVFHVEEGIKIVDTDSVPTVVDPAN